MEPEPATRDDPQGVSRATHPWVTALGVVIALVSAAFSIFYTYNSTEAARDTEERLAREAIVANVLLMAEHHQARASGYSNAIQLLAADSSSLIEEFGQEALALHPTLYRQIAEYVAFSGGDVPLAQEMAGTAIEEALEDGARLEVIRGHRILASVAARVGDPEEMLGHFGEALSLSETYLEDEPNLGRSVVAQTRAFRLLGAYLGAQRTTDEEVNEQFCSLAAEWRDDLRAIKTQMHASLVELQVLRIARSGDPDDLVTTCEPAE